MTVINRDYTKNIFRNDILRYNPNPILGGSCKSELDNVLKLLIETETKALATNEKDYILNDVTYKLLMRLEEEGIAANLRIATEAT